MARILGRKKESIHEALPEESLRAETIQWGDLTWVNIEKPTEKEMKYLEETFHFHPLALYGRGSELALSEANVVRVREMLIYVTV